MGEGLVIGNPEKRDGATELKVVFNLLVAHTVNLNT